MDMELTWLVLRNPLTQIALVTGITQATKQIWGEEGKAAVYLSLISSLAIALAVTHYTVGSEAGQVALGMLRGIAVWLAANGLYKRIQAVV
jgi:hypothetical protein